MFVTRGVSRNLAMTALGSPPEEVVVVCRGGAPVAIQTDSHSTGKARRSFSIPGDSEEVY
jgi:hypothetical protein